MSSLPLDSLVLYVDFWNGFLYEYAYNGTHRHYNLTVVPDIPIGSLQRVYVFRYFRFLGIACRYLNDSTILDICSRDIYEFQFHNY